MAHLKLVYDSKSDFQSRVCSDLERVVNYDEDGNEHITYERVDYPKIQDSLGSFVMWSLQSLMDAGIDPKFGICTGFNTRLEGELAVSDASKRLISVVESVNKFE